LKLISLLSVAFAALALQTAEPVKVAFYNIRAGQGVQPLRGHAATFADGVNCADTNKPVNAWGVGLIQRELDRLKADPQVVAIGLAEAWFCASPDNVRKALGWKQHTGEQNGTGLVARYGFKGKADWLQLDTALNKNPRDAMWVVRAAVCTDPSCARTLDVYAAHWSGTGPSAQDVFDHQAADTVKFMAGSRGPHVLVGDLNIFEGASVVCNQKPNNSSLNVLRQAGYTDAWPALHPNDPGYTGMLNRAGCGTPEGAPWKRIDYAWSKGLTPIAIERFGLPAPGEGAPSDHAGILATWR
jgi:hypothetical protein